MRRLIQEHIRLIVVTVLTVAGVALSAMAVNIGRPHGVKSQSVNKQVVCFTLSDGRRIDSSNIGSYTQKAAAGDRDALYIVGVQHHLGLDVPVDKSVAAQYYLQAATAGEPHTCLELGYDYDRSLDERIAWMEKAADADIQQTMTELAQIYRDQKRDNENALKWFVRSADTFGDQFSSYCAGHIYQGKQDYENALKYYRLTIENYNADPTKGDKTMAAGAYRNLGNMIKSGNIKDYSPDDAFNYYRRAHELDPDQYTSYSLGYCYENGYGVEQDYTEPSLCITPPNCLNRAPA